MSSIISKSLWSLCLLMMVSVFSSCGDHHDHSDEGNTVIIDLISPVPDKKVDEPSNIIISVNFSATVSQHKLEVTLTPVDKPEEKIISWVNNTHEKYFEYRKTINLASYADGTSFLLKLKSCSDHDCINFLEREFTFTI